MASSPSDDDDDTFLPVENGLFQTKSIVGTNYRLKPKDFACTKLSKCVYRKTATEFMVTALEKMVKEENNHLPGLYLQGPAGVGKSIMLYTIAQIAKFQFQWITVYVPDCTAWKLNSVVAMGFFLDRVVDAFSEDHLRQTFPEIWSSISRSETNPDRHYWEDAAQDRSNPAGVSSMELTYNKVKRFLHNQTNKKPVQLVFDEVNALWDNGGGYFGKPPWEIMDFRNPRLEIGALLVSGTTDSEFQGTIPSGYDDQCIYRISEMTPAEAELVLTTELGRPLQLIRAFDEELWHGIFDASGSMPRELAKFALDLEPYSSRLEAASRTALDEPARKKLKVDISSAVANLRAEKRATHLRAATEIIKKDQRDNITTFKDALFKWCKNYFLMNELNGELEILRVPNFIISDGARMRPTTVDANIAYFNWFQEECESRRDALLSSSVVRYLGTLCSAESNGSERGHALDRYLSHRLTLHGLGEARLHYHCLHGNPTQTHSLPFQVTSRVFAKAANPPKNFRSLPAGSLLTHVDQDGGESRVDMILYSKNNQVIYLEATVGNYRNTKLPTIEDDGRRAAKILASIQKWLGDDVYNVEVDETSQQISVTYREAYTSRSHTDRPDPPSVHYVVVTTCPSEVWPAAARATKYSWIKVCFLEDLIESAIINKEFKDRILEAQAEDAGRPSLLTSST